MKIRCTHCGTEGPLPQPLADDAMLRCKRCGNEWTPNPETDEPFEQIKRGAQTQPSVPEYDKRLYGWAAFIGGVLVVIGTYLPWIEVKTILGDFELQGLGYWEDATQLLVLGIVAIVLAAIYGLVEGSAVGLALILGVLGVWVVVVTGYILVNTNEAISPDGALLVAQVGSGLYVALVGGVILAIFGLLGAVAPSKRPTVGSKFQTKPPVQGTGEKSSERGRTPRMGGSETTPSQDWQPHEEDFVIGSVVEVKATDRGKLIIRASPTRTAVQVDEVTPNERLRVLDSLTEGEGSHWYRVEVESSGVGGWALAAYLSQVHNLDKGLHVLAVGDYRLEVRHGPQLNSMIAWTVPQGTELVIIGGPKWSPAGFVWYNVYARSTGKKGWALGQYLRKT